MLTKNQRDIKEFIKKRRIVTLAHFTQLENLDSILRNGLLSKEALAQKQISYTYNDELRLEGKNNALCLSISFTTLKKNNTFSVESAFQSSKKFEFGGPYKELLDKDPRTAKKDIRLKTSEKLVSFIFFNQEWPIEPKTLFYDWLYINSLYKNKTLAEAILSYDAFTDIEFNHNKSINYQAYSAALFVSLAKRGLIEQAIKGSDQYKEIILKQNVDQTTKQTIFF